MTQPSQIFEEEKPQNQTPMTPDKIEVPFSFQHIDSHGLHSDIFHSDNKDKMANRTEQKIEEANNIEQKEERIQSAPT